MKKLRKKSKRCRTREYKTIVDSKISAFAKKMKIQIRVGPTLESSGLIHKSNHKGIFAVYCGNGIIWLKDRMPYPVAMQQLVILHEIGHAIMLYWMRDGSITDKMQEINANASALTLSSFLRIPVHRAMLYDMIRYTKTKSLRLRG